MATADNTRLKELAKQYRIELLEMLHGVQTGHPGGSLSAVEIMLLLYKEVMRFDPKNPEMPGRDRFVLSKGHAAPILYLTLAHEGFFPVDDLKQLRQMGSHLQGHPCHHKTPGVELSTGPLGLGLSAAVGMALSARLKQSDETIYVLIGDGEIQEGVVWEALMSASKFQVDNLCVILDYNGVQLDGTLEDIMPMGDVEAKFKAFGWHSLLCDGHDFSSLRSAFSQAKAVKGKPTVIIAKTVKGKGVSFMEGKSTWHGKPISQDEYASAMNELRGQAV